MAKVAGAQNFDGRNWHEQHIAKRTRAALEEQDRAFAERHAGDTLAELACYLPVSYTHLTLPTKA